MIIKKVIYHLFKSDITRNKKLIKTRKHIIDGEIELKVNDKKSIFISWTNKPIQCSIGISDHSFFNSGVLHGVNVTKSEIWKDLIEKELEYKYIGEDNQILQINSGTTRVYCSSYNEGFFGRDTVYISKIIPKVQQKNS